MWLSACWMFFSLKRNIYGILFASMLPPPSSYTEPHLQKHHGIFRKELSLLEATSLIISGTIGAGILGLPFALQHLGAPLAVLSLFVFGALTIFLNLLLGRLAEKAGRPLQLVGLAKHYLGRTGEILMSVVMYATLFGVLTIYIIGAGEALQGLFGGDALGWSTIFFAVASILVFLGLRTLKKTELFLSLGILLVVLLLSFVSAGHIDREYLVAANPFAALFPYGVLIFALHGTTSIPEAYSLLPHNVRAFRKAVVMAGISTVIVYMLFVVTVIGVTGPLTTPVATIGLGEKVGPVVHVLANVFAILAMSTSFLMGSLALRDSLVWDWKVSRVTSSLFVCTVPFIIFMLGLRQFTAAIDVVGGWFMTIEILLILAMALAAHVVVAKNKTTP